MGDRIAVLNEGVMHQVDRPLNLYNHPANLFVGGFIGSPAMNFLDASLHSADGAWYVAAGDLRLRLPDARAELLQPYAGKTVVVGVRPDDIYDRSLPMPIAATPDNSLTLTVDVTEPMGARVHAYLTSGAHSLVASLDSETRARDGEPLEVVFDVERVHIFDKETEQAVF